ncbi:TetR/AcrR family transcriptional regulator [Oceanobacillus sp. FSL H7-0719]|uniref:TetR/AcrR family transcriptional regulator n=1 Tax=Oceanobacillus sp. FSL H7-0719 TaxID=2954507 RepID=UPI003252B891
MPKATFFNLPEKKRASLIKACEREFSRVPVFEASIANIVKSAGISRGSFYQYFEDKEDAYYYILHEQAKRRNQAFKHHLQVHEGDLFEAITAFYYELLIELPDDKEYNFLRNALLNVTHQIETIFNEIIEGHVKQNGLYDLSELINKDILNIETDDELQHVIQIVSAIAFRNFVEKFTKELSDEEAIKNFKAEMNLLKKGLAK